MITRIFKSIWKATKNLSWALIVAFMIGVHNFYTGETKSKDDIVFTVEQEVIEEDSAPKGLKLKQSTKTLICFP
jgi:hypothetical protein